MPPDHEQSSETEKNKKIRGLLSGCGQIRLNPARPGYRADKLRESLQGADMSESLRCPNPICSHIFSEAELAGAGTVSCPRCGMVAQIQASEALSGPSPT